MGSRAFSDSPSFHAGLVHESSSVVTGLVSHGASDSQCGTKESQSNRAVQRPEHAALDREPNGCEGAEAIGGGRNGSMEAADASPEKLAKRRRAEVDLQRAPEKD